MLHHRSGPRAGSSSARGSCVKGGWVNSLASKGSGDLGEVNFRESGNSLWFIFP